MAAPGRVCALLSRVPEQASSTLTAGPIYYPARNPVAITYPIQLSAESSCSCNPGQGLPAALTFMHHESNHRCRSHANATLYSKEDGSFLASVCHENIVYEGGL